MIVSNLKTKQPKMADMNQEKIQSEPMRAQTQPQNPIMNYMPKEQKTQTQAQNPIMNYMPKEQQSPQQADNPIFNYLKPSKTQTTNPSPLSPQQPSLKPGSLAPLNNAGSSENSLNSANNATRQAQVQADLNRYLKPSSSTENSAASTNLDNLMKYMPKQKNTEETNQPAYSAQELAENPLLHYAKAPNVATSDVTPGEVPLDNTDNTLEEEIPLDTVPENTKPTGELGNAYQTVEDFENQMKNLYGEDYSIADIKGMNSYEASTYQQNMLYLKQLQQDYKSLESTIKDKEKNASAQRQEAYIQQELLKKYLPTQLKSQGLGGLGVSQSAYIEANNNYSNQIAGINSDYDSQASDSLQNFNTTASNGLANTTQNNNDALKEYQFNNKLEADEYLQNYDTSNVTKDELLNLYKDKLSKDDFETFSKKLDDQDMIRNTSNFENSFNNTVSSFEITSGADFNQGQIDRLKTDLEAQKGKINDAKYNELQNAIDSKQKHYNDVVKPRDVGESMSGKFFNQPNNGYNDNLSNVVIRYTTPTSEKDIKDKVKKFRDGGIDGSEQTKRVNTIFDAAKNGTLPNETVVDFNKGHGRYLFVYKDGNFYEADN